MTGKLLIKHCLLRMFITTILCFPFIVCGQEAGSKSVKDGWALHLGAGYLYGGNIGFLGERQIIVKENLRISPFVATGIGEGEKDSTNKRYDWLGLSTGVMMEYGSRHRVIFGPQFVLEQAFGKSEKVKKNQMPSASFIIGYKRTSDIGLIWQVYIGDIYTQDPTVYSKAYEHKSHVGIGVGYKF